jgi:hypothetical protein
VPHPFRHFLLFVLIEATMSKPEPVSELDRETRPEWLETFAAEGISGLERLLAKHAAFHEYLGADEAHHSGPNGGTA